MRIHDMGEHIALFVTSPGSSFRYDGSYMSARVAKKSSPRPIRPSTTTLFYSPRRFFSFYIPFQCIIAIEALASNLTAMFIENRSSFLLIVIATLLIYYIS